MKQIEKLLDRLLDEYGKRIGDNYDDIQRDLVRELRPFYFKYEGKVMTESRRLELKNIIKRIVKRYHADIRDEVKHMSNDAAIIGHTGLLYEIELEHMILIPLMVMLYSMNRDDYKKDEVHREYTARDLEFDGKNYADRILRNNNKLITGLVVKVSSAISQGVGLKRLEKIVKDSTKNTSDSIKNIKNIESARVREEAEADTADELVKVGILTVKTWITVEDHKVRHTHQHLHNKTISVDDYFTTRNGRALHPRGFGVPQEDINCRCILRRSVRTIHNKDDFEKYVSGKNRSYEEWMNHNGYYVK